MEAAEIRPQQTRRQNMTRKQRLARRKKASQRRQIAERKKRRDNIRRDFLSKTSQHFPPLETPVKHAARECNLDAGRKQLCSTPSKTRTYGTVVKWKSSVPNHSVWLLSMSLLDSLHCVTFFKAVTTHNR